MNLIKLYITLSLILGLSACSKFLDVTPDNVATIQTSFTLRESAEHYLATCYSFIPPILNMVIDPACGYWGGESWGIKGYNNYTAFLWSQGEQGKVEPKLNSWDGINSGFQMYIAIRDCNIFLDNIGKVVNISDDDRARWIAEVKFLKAFYLFYLVKEYGPIILMRNNLPISASIAEVRQYREPVDSCFSYIVNLIDEAIPDLPKSIVNKQAELGRITSPVAASIKAKILVYAASPLFNGNSDYSDFIDNRNIQLFNQQYSPEKWKLAADACKQAIDLCEGVGNKLYYYQSDFQYDISDTTITKMSIRNSFSDDEWNSELIWGDAKNKIDQAGFTPLSWDPNNIPQNFPVSGRFGPSIEFVSLFYTNHGLPIDEDKSWDYQNRFELQAATEADKYYVEEGYTTVKFNLNREPRFYADLGFDGSIWYGQGRYDDKNSFVIKCKAGQYTGAQVANIHTPTGYFPKKIINYKNVITSNAYNRFYYPTRRLRLADLYLLYAEAKNEADGPGPEVYKYINMVRERAGIPTVQESWSQWSDNPDKYTTKEGLREIIRRERIIELAFESENYWDQRRWKTAEEAFNKPVSGWDITQMDFDKYNQKRLLFQPHFDKRDYLFPIREYSTFVNPNLIQNPGW